MFKLFVYCISGVSTLVCILAKYFEQTNWQLVQVYILVKNKLLFQYDPVGKEEL